MSFNTLKELVKSAGFDYIGVRVYSQSDLDCVVEFCNSYGYSGQNLNYEGSSGNVYCFLDLDESSKDIVMGSEKEEYDFVLPYPIFKDFFLKSKSADIEGLI